MRSNGYLFLVARIFLFIAFGVAVHVSFRTLDHWNVDDVYDLIPLIILIILWRYLDEVLRLAHQRIKAQTREFSRNDTGGAGWP